MSCRWLGNKALIDINYKPEQLSRLERGTYKYSICIKLCRGREFDPLLGQIFLIAFRNKLSCFISIIMLFTLTFITVFSRLDHAYNSFNIEVELRSIKLNFATYFMLGLFNGIQSVTNYNVIYWSSWISNVKTLFLNSLCKIKIILKQV